MNINLPIMDNLFREIERRARRGQAIPRAALSALPDAVKPWLEPPGRVTPALQKKLFRLETVAAPHFSTGAAAAFQTFLAGIGAKMRGPIAMPEHDTPYWLLGPHPLAGFQSAPELPKRADVVVIGCGLTGASAAYHLAAFVPKGLGVVVLEAGDPAQQASGRNGGNFELMPENFLGEYQGLPEERFKWLSCRHPRGTETALRAEANQQAAAIFRFGSRNARRFVTLVRRERMDCDLSVGGWLRIADTAAEEKGIFDEVRFAAQVGVHFTLWSPEKIRREIGIPARFSGRLAEGNGNYHPFKFVCGALQKAVQRGVQLFTRTPVLSLQAGRHENVRLVTARGTMEAPRVLFATNAFTATLLPELAAIRYYQSQIFNLEHVSDTIRGMTVTEKKGDLYYNFPAAMKYRDSLGRSRGMLHVGGGLDRPGRNPAQLRRSQAVLELVKHQTDERFPETQGQPPSRVWTGPMAFTPDRAPVIGFLRREKWPGRALIVAAGFNGYGGTYCVETGHLAAQMAVTGKTPPELPEAMFSPHRFLNDAGALTFR